MNYCTRHWLYNVTRKAFLIVMSSLYILTTQTTHAALIDFESLNSPQTRLIGKTYQEDGYTLESLTRNMPFASFGTQDTRFVESTALFSNISNGLIRLTRSDNALFDFLSIGLAELNDLGGKVTFTGTFGKGGTITQTVQLDGNKGFQTFSLMSEFVGLSQVTWIQNSPYHQFDNISVEQYIEPQATPIPPSGWLFASLLISYVVWSQRAKHPLTPQRVKI